MFLTIEVIGKGGGAGIASFSSSGAGDAASKFLHKLNGKNHGET
jgi:hypothetical protein